MEKIIEVENLKKSYGEIEAVKGIDFYVEKGKMFAFLGPNGAGKSTTIDIICTFLKPDAGKVTVDGHILGEEDGLIRSKIGAVFQDGLLDALLTVEENLRLRGGFYKLKGAALADAVKYAAEVTDIADLLKRPYGKLSGGQRRRCDIARALLHTPKVLFLDEPTTGLDPQTRKSVWDTVEKLQNSLDMTIFFSTHYMEEAAKADYVVIIDNGLIVAKGTPSALKERHASDRLGMVPTDADKVIEILEARGAKIRRVAEQIITDVPSTMDALPLVEACRDYISGFEVVHGTMDDVFIAITGKEIRE